MLRYTKYLKEFIRSNEDVLLEVSCLVLRVSVISNIFTQGIALKESNFKVKTELPLLVLQL